MQQVATLRVGDQGPNFELEDVQGRKHQLADLLQDGPLALVFFRGTWCGTCRAYIRMLDRRSAEYLHLGVRVVGIAHQRADFVASYFRLEPVKYLYLLDTTMKVIPRYGLLVEHEDAEDALKSGTDSTTYPAVFLLDAAGVIRWQHIGRDYADLPSGEQIEQAIRQTGLAGKQREVSNGTN